MARHRGGLADLSSGRHRRVGRHECASDVPSGGMTGKIVLFAAFDRGGPGPKQGLYVVDPATNVWTEMIDVPVKSDHRALSFPPRARWSADRVPFREKPGHCPDHNGPVPRSPRGGPPGPIGNIDGWPLWGPEGKSLIVVSRSPRPTTAGPPVAPPGRSTTRVPIGSGSRSPRRIRAWTGRPTAVGSSARRRTGRPICVQHPDGTERRRVAGGWQPRVSPDSTRVASIARSAERPESMQGQTLRVVDLDDGPADDLLSPKTRSRRGRLVARRQTDPHNALDLDEDRVGNGDTEESPKHDRRRRRPGPVPPASPDDDPGASRVGPLSPIGKGASCTATASSAPRRPAARCSSDVPTASGPWRYRHCSGIRRRPISTRKGATRSRRGRPLRGEGPERDLPVHGRRAVAGRHVRPQAPARPRAWQADRDEDARHAVQRPGELCSNRPGHSNPEGRAGFRSVICSRMWPSVSTTWRSSGRWWRTSRNIRRRITSCIPARGSRAGRARGRG